MTDYYPEAPKVPNREQIAEQLGVEVTDIPTSSANDCPECRQGKHATCAEWSMDDADNVVPCPCAEREHRMVSEAVRVYRVLSRVAGDEVWYECPICGPLDGAVLKGHGPNHMVEDASR